MSDKSPRNDNHQSNSEQQQDNGDIGAPPEVLPEIVQNVQNALVISQNIDPNRNIRPNPFNGIIQYLFLREMYQQQQQLQFVEGGDRMPNSPCPHPRPIVSLPISYSEMLEQQIIPDPLSDNQIIMNMPIFQIPEFTNINGTDLQPLRLPTQFLHAGDGSIPLFSNSRNNQQFQGNFYSQFFNNQLQFLQQFQPNPQQQREILRRRQSANQAQPTHINQKYYQKRKNIVNYNWDFNESEPHLKISFVKQNAHIHDQDEAYYITEKGLWKSQKNTDIDDIMIGRQQNVSIETEEIHPNDIVLPITDRAISRVHCKILTQDGFRKHDQIQEEFRIFLTACSTKSSTYWKRLPLNVLYIIQAFTRRNVGQFCIQDLGSVQGTFIKIRNNREHLMELGNSYFIGAETTFHVIAPLVNMAHHNETNIDLFYEYLSYLKSLGDEIKGLDAREYSLMEHARIQNPTFQYHESYFLRRPIIRVQLNNTPTTHDPSLVYTFIGNANHESVFKFGRNQDNDIIINQNTISRKQCRIKYCPINQKWFISDGEQLRESSNGTWMSLCNNVDRRLSDNQDRKESDRRVIENNTEIKISESVLKIEMFNFHKRYGY